MATHRHSTNIVPITSSPRFLKALGAVPAPLTRSPELAVMVAILYALPRKQRAAVKRALFRKAFDNAGDDNLARAYHHIGRVL